VSRSFVVSIVAKQSDEIPHLYKQKVSPFAFCIILLKEKGLAVLKIKLMTIVFKTDNLHSQM
jgi:hypothetical protein